MKHPSKTVRVNNDTKLKIQQLCQEQGLSEGDIVSQKFAVSPTEKIGPLPKEATKEQGVIYISSATGNIYKSPKITIAKIRELLQNPYIVSKLEKRSITYFPERVKIEAFDPKQNLDPEVTKIFQNMCEVEDVRLSDKVTQGDNDSYCYGLGVYNPVWSRQGGRIILQKLRHLPAWSFDAYPMKNTSLETWSNLLPGIILGADGTPEYWQRKNSISSDTDQITNVMVVKDPKDESLAGDSDLIPLVSTVEMLKFVLNTEMQVINRAGSPIFFIKIKAPYNDGTEDNGYVSDVDFANEIIENISKDNTYNLRENMEIIPVPFDPKKNNLETESVLRSIIDEYFSVVDQLSRDEPNLGGNGIPKLKLLIQAIKGRHNWLLAPFESMLNQYFVLNSYPDGWNVRLSIDVWEEDKAEIHLKQGDMAYKWGVAHPKELRKLAGLEPADEPTWKEINDFYTGRQQAQTTATFTTHSHHYSEEGEGEPLDPIAGEMLKELQDEIDELSGKVFKAVMKEVAA